MIFPFGGEGTRDLTELLERPTRPRIQRPRPRWVIEEDVPVCIDPAGQGREKHSPDKDDRCVFCNRLLFRRPVEEP